jgi:hypothetical protein
MTPRGPAPTGVRGMVRPVTIEAKTRLRDKRQVTLPEPVATASHAEAGDEFVAAFDPSNPDVIVLRRVRDTYFGALRDAGPEAGPFVEAERAAWGAGR